MHKLSKNGPGKSKLQKLKLNLLHTYVLTNGEKGLLEIHFFEKFDKVAKLGKAAEDV